MATRPLPQLRQMLAEDGLRRTLRHLGGFAVERVHDAVLDARLGIRTGRRIDPAALGITDPHAEKYAPSDHRSLRRALARIDLRPREDVFLDYGSGMGRALIIAARSPFRRVIGVELSPELQAIARDNLDRTRARLRCEVELVEADAGAYRVPEDVTVVWFYSPFRGPVLAAALDQLRASWERRPRRLWVLYKDPADLEALLPAHPWLTVVDELHRPGEHERRRILICRAGGSGDGPG